ncbi:MAG: hypothetical protein PHX52_00890 [Candidatus Pacebacteria bacterium]|nr:hypothetical protein [Candidatus Paceibacterota bacterium]
MFISKKKLALVFVAVIIVAAACMTLGFLSQEPIIVPTQIESFDAEQINIEEQLVTPGTGYMGLNRPEEWLPRDQFVDLAENKIYYTERNLDGNFLQTYWSLKGLSVIVYGVYYETPPFHTFEKVEAGLMFYRDDAAWFKFIIPLTIGLVFMGLIMIYFMPTNSRKRNSC